MTTVAAGPTVSTSDDGRLLAHCSWCATWWTQVPGTDPGRARRSLESAHPPVPHPAVRPAGWYAPASCPGALSQ